MRLFLLLGLLGLGLFGVIGLGGAPQNAPRAVAADVARPADTGAEVSRATDAPGARGLPPAVRRLADQPVTGPARPVILQEAAIDPDAVQPMQALRAAAAAASVARDGTATLRRVTANSVNVRGGPSTQNPVVGRLTRGEEVEVLATDPSGWVQVRVQGDGVEGWVSERLLGR